MNHFHSEKCWATGPGDTEVLVCGFTPTVTMMMCGGKAADRCPVDGAAHDMSQVVRYHDGGSVACSKCGVSAMSIDMMRLP